MLEQKKNEIIATAKVLYNPAIAKIKNNVKIPPSMNPSNMEPEFAHVYALICASMQYNFWYKDSGTRIKLDSKILDELVLEEMTNADDFKSSLPLIKDKLTQIGGPKLVSRLQSLSELNKIDLEIYSKYHDNTEGSLRIISTLPMFQEDPFFKKGALALQQSALYQGITFDFVVPADYQLPKVLESLGVIEYSKSLSNKIKNDIVIPEGSKEEVAIRAATVLACIKLAKDNKITSTEVDQWLFHQKNAPLKHHLCDTTNY